eukprot:1922019-Prymnesium_polylepis.1
MRAVESAWRGRLRVNMHAARRFERARRAITTRTLGRTCRAWLFGSSPGDDGNRRRRQVDRIRDARDGRSDDV